MNRLRHQGFNVQLVPGVMSQTPKFIPPHMPGRRRSPPCARVRRPPTAPFKTELGVYHDGLLSRKGRSHPPTPCGLNANGDNVHVWVDSKTGAVLNHFLCAARALPPRLQQEYNGDYNTVDHREGNPLTGVAPAPSRAPIPPGMRPTPSTTSPGRPTLFASASSRLLRRPGSKMRHRPIYSDYPATTDQVPERHWNARHQLLHRVTATTYVCTSGVHAYTQVHARPHLLLPVRPLNESYSDIYGETLDS